MRTILVQLLVCVVAISSHAQGPDITPLFQEEQPLTIRLRVSLKNIKKNTNDSTYIPATMHYKNAQNEWDSIQISIRARGNFRREYCYFLPMRIKIKKGDAKETLFAGNKSLKLVLPCQTAKNNNTLLMKEYICYQLYEPATRYFFNTRLLNITFEDWTDKQTKTYQLMGFFIEDDDVVADRFHAKEIESKNLHPLALQDTNSVRHDIFEYMIANTDWSSTFFHNVKIIQTQAGGYIPIPYDFDMSGFVNAPYAKGNAELAITDVRDRMYRGFCRKEPLVQFVRREYIDLEPTINSIIQGYESSFEAKEFATIKKYMEDFFVILKSDSKFKENILQKCRTK